MILLTCSLNMDYFHTDYSSNIKNSRCVSYEKNHITMFKNNTTDIYYKPHLQFSRIPNSAWISDTVCVMPMDICKLYIYYEFRLRRQIGIRQSTCIAVTADCKFSMQYHMTFFNLDIPRKCSFIFLSILRPGCGGSEGWIWLLSFVEKHHGWVHLLAEQWHTSVCNILNSLIN